MPGKEVKMRKTYTIFLIIIGIILIGSVGLFFTSGPNSGYKSQYERTISVKNHVSDPVQLNGNFMVDETGDYRLSLFWNPTGAEKQLSENEIGFVTAVVITDSEERVILIADGLSLDMNTEIRLEKGVVYGITHYFFTDKDAYSDFAKTYLCSLKEADQLVGQYRFDQLAKDGTWALTYQIKVAPIGLSAGNIAAVVFGIILSMILTVILLISINKNHRMELAKYDERQEMERGYGFKYAFFTSLTYLLALLILDATEFFARSDMRLFYAGGIFLSISVYVVYCIWTESYFALNQNKRSVMIIFITIAAFNLFLGIINIMNGNMVENGHLTVHIANLMCAALFLVLFITVLLKKHSDNKDNDYEE